ncbi:MAG TPA: hypothetical protein VN929_12620 [Burkholderiales bacterium]|nr:hypothetical protein [Burkholderiales bacterium]
MGLDQKEVIPPQNVESIAHHIRNTKPKVIAQTATFDTNTNFCFGVISLNGLPRPLFGASGFEGELLSSMVITLRGANLSIGLNGLRVLEKKKPLQRGV